MKNRAYSVLDIKAIDEEKRIITGIASTPSPDRMDDIVEPKGAQFTLPIPFLWQHRHGEPVGHVVDAKVSDNGISVTIQLAKIDEPGTLKNRLDEAWQSIKSGLVRGLSIGFSPLETADIEGSWGYRFLKWDWLELSAVTIPANAEANIQTIKSFDLEQRAASGMKPAPKVARLIKAAGASAMQTKSNQSNRPEGMNMNIAEQIKGFKDSRKAKAEQMNVLMSKAADEGRGLDASESEEFETLEQEVSAIDKQLARLEVMEKMNIETAKPVVDQTKQNNRVPVVAKNTQKLEPGIAFARAAKCLALGHLEHRDAIQIAKSVYAGQDDVIRATQRLVTKAAVGAATTSDSTWAGALVGDETSVFADFVEYLRPMTIIGRFGTGGVPSLRRVPFRVPLIGQTSGGDGYWVGEGQAKPLTKFDFARTTLEPLKVANIAVATMEVIRDSSPSADVIIRDQLSAALRERMDIDFIDPAKAASAGVSPASILNGITPIPSSGVDADAVRADLKAIFMQFIAANNAPTSGVWIMSSTTALSLSLMTNALGQSEFPGITMNGGTLAGLPVVTSEYTPSDTSGSIVALVNASDIYLGDEGGIDLSMSTEASLQMDSEPANPTVAATVLVSLWQRNLVGFRAERAINWARRRTSAVAYLDGVNWGS